ncbi:GTP-binding protein [Arthrobacter pityocampae]|uniref:GTP-binding protein n=1 Tax=Arthrobacter pityocampae TaxID=547334 RepID=A0A2S5IYG6_9MICC|nr:dynamin family protein [Arthrobacter pityocampae]PPB49599.1 GTP-binding protein [Arthrobacter pityocampae]
MTDSGAVEALLADALQVYADDPGVRTELEGYAQRLREPLRVAVAGMVKAGKSTLLNAIIGEEIAPTDTGECTRIVTWYRYAATPRIILHPVDGEPRPLPLTRVDGRLVLDLGGQQAEDVARLVVDWPAENLRAMTLIDTPGIASLSTDVSARSTRFLTPEDAPSEADAVIYLMRHLHASDLLFLEAFHDTSAARSGTVNALAVLSRADEVGAGRLDSLIAASRIADRYRADASLRSLVLDVLPMAGLLAQSARTLRQAEFRVFAALAALERTERERTLISADRFVAASADLGIAAEDAARLLDRFGMFGLRLGAALVRGGSDSATALAHELARRSGLDQLLTLMTRQFHARAIALRVRTALTGLEVILAAHPRDAAARLHAGIERITASAHELNELTLLSALRAGRVQLPAPATADAERLVGGSGTAAADRLGLAPGAGPGQVRTAALERLHRWRVLAENPLTNRGAQEACQLVVRTCEELVVRAGPDGASVQTDPAAEPEPRGEPVSVRGARP